MVKQQVNQQQTIFCKADEGGTTMENILFALKGIEFLVIEALVIAAVAAVLIAGVYEVVRAKVQEARRRDRIAQAPAVKAPVASQPARP
jgi:NADH:ubiquinone oxidoreductase subunit F (NADH-binding)